MARIAGVEIPNQKRIEIGLTFIFGIGRPRSKMILEKTKIDLDKKVKDLSADELGRIRKHIESSEIVEGDLRKNTNQDIKRLMDINSYRGRRHQRGLPVRGQRTKTNARTRKGPRGAMIKKRK
ncbi:MAG: 30S ribosomal protein S13 [Candidatus Aminicenantes bacterium]|nr:30S ribosomal protein S13 [Candidatus Aminicenantes bacterium]